MRESPPPPQSLCSVESELASGRGRGAGRRGAGGAGSARLTPWARSVLAPPRPGPGGGPPPLLSLPRGAPMPLALLAYTRTLSFHSDPRASPMHMSCPGAPPSSTPSNPSPNPTKISGPPQAQVHPSASPLNPLVHLTPSQPHPVPSSIPPYMRSILVLTLSLSLSSSP